MFKGLRGIFSKGGGKAEKPILRYTDPLTQKSKTYVIDKDRITLGRSQSNDVMLIDPEQRVSRLHAVMMFMNGRWMVQDQGSKYGLWVNDKPVIGSQVLNNGDVVRLAAIELIFGAPTQDVANEEQSQPIAPPPVARPASPTAKTVQASWEGGALLDDADRTEELSRHTLLRDDAGQDEMRHTLLRDDMVQDAGRHTMLRDDVGQDKMRHTMLRDDAGQDEMRHTMLRSGPDPKTAPPPTNDFGRTAMRPVADTGDDDRRTMIKPDDTAPTNPVPPPDWQEYRKRLEQNLDTATGVGKKVDDDDMR
jgi:hypothetical protein